MPVMLRCETCGREYPTIPAEAARGRRFCSNRCRGVWIATRKTDEQRFWEKVDKAGPMPPHAPDLGPCWLWTGHRMVTGYGAIGKRKPGGGFTWVYAHRRSWEMANGPIPDRKHILHACDTPPCVNPAHLSLGTQAENTADAAEKGRMRQGDRHPVARLRARYIPEIEAMHKAGLSYARIAAVYGVTHQTIGDVLLGRSWKSVPRGKTP